MTIHVFAAAKRVGIKTDWSKSNLEMQKIIYIAHMMHLGNSMGPLVDGFFQAWDLGPVHPDLYHKAKIFGADPVKNIFRTIDVPENTPETGSLDNTLNIISCYSGTKLVAITHWESGAWYENYIPGKKHIVIPNVDILKEYNKRVARAQSKQ